MSAERERDIDDRIADWVDGRLTGRDRDRFVAELRVNAQLRTDLEQYERTVGAVRAALQAPTRPVQLADRVLAAIAAEPARPAPASHGLLRRPVLWSLLSAAALLTIALLVDAWSAPTVDHARTTARLDDAARPAPDDDASGVAGEADQETKVDVRLLKSEGVDRQRDRDAAAGSKEMQQELDVAELLGGRAPGTTGTRSEPAPSVPPAEAAKAPGDEGGFTQKDVAENTRTMPSRQVPAAAGENEPAADQRAETPLAGPEAPSQPSANAVTAVTTGSAEPLPLLVVLGQAPAASDLFAARARKGQKGDGAAGANSSAAKAPDDAGRRFEEFFTAQVAEMTQAPAGTRRGGGAKSPAETRAAERDAPADAAAAWLQVAEVRMRRLAAPRPPVTAEREADAAAKWIERDWLVEGSRQGIAGLLGRLATFTAEAKLELRTGETTAVPVEEIAAALSDDLFLGASGEDRQRIVLRFRLQPR